MSRENLVRAALAVALALVLGWLVTATEWVTVDIPGKPTGEAASNSLYATQSLVRALGGTVVRRETLDGLPPPQATLVLTSAHWDLLPANVERLRQWVEHGGHLVIPGHMVQHLRFKEWLPVTRIEKTIRRDKPAQQPTAAPKGTAGELVDGSVCHDVQEMDDAVAPPVPPHVFRLCAQVSYFLKSTRVPLWHLDGPEGPEALRVAVGQGAVTVVVPSDIALKRAVLWADNAQVLVAALRLRPRSEVWFVVDEKRPPLGVWLWAHAWQAVVLGLLALAAAVWRNGARFGPLAAQAGSGRRSVAEQVRGTAQFLRKQGGDALHRAQLRALDEMAARYIPRYRDMALDRAARAQAIAQAAQLDHSALARALNPTLRRSAHDVQATLQLLETARRRLRESAMQARPTTNNNNPFSKEDHAD